MNECFYTREKNRKLRVAHKKRDHKTNLNYRFTGEPKIPRDLGIGAKSVSKIVLTPHICTQNFKTY
jgi:hypothetical protein